MVSIVYTTTPDRNSAENIAKNLLENNMIACANFFPINSLYMWYGDVKSSEEYAVILKTTKENADAVHDALKGIHAYDVPCIMLFDPTSANILFTEWVHNSVVL